MTCVNKFQKVRPVRYIESVPSSDGGGLRLFTGVEVRCVGGCDVVVVVARCCTGSTGAAGADGARRLRLGGCSPPSRRKEASLSNNLTTISNYIT